MRKITLGPKNDDLWAEHPFIEWERREITEDDAYGNIGHQLKHWSVPTNGHSLGCLRRLYSLIYDAFEIKKESPGFEVYVILFTSRLSQVLGEYPSRHEQIEWARIIILNIFFLGEEQLNRALERFEETFHKIEMLWK